MDLKSMTFFIPSFLEDLAGWIEISRSRRHFFDPDLKLAVSQSASLGSGSKKCLLDRLISIHPTKSSKNGGMKNVILFGSIRAS